MGFQHLLQLLPFTLAQQLLVLQLQNMWAQIRKALQFLGLHQTMMEVAQF